SPGRNRRPSVAPPRHLQHRPSADVPRTNQRRVVRRARSAPSHAMIDAMAESDDRPGAQDWRDEARDLYERYIDAFNARDEARFCGFCPLPVSIMRRPADGTDGPGRAPHLVTEAAQLWPVLPATWTRST